MPVTVDGRAGCVVVGDDDAAPRWNVVLCHGFGAPGSDLVPLAEELLTLGATDEPDPRWQGVRFYFPAAPLDLAASGFPGGRAWWPLDIDRLTRTLPEKRVAELRRTRPEGIDAARDALLDTLRRIEAETGLPPGRWVLGGFSQGAMVTCEVAFVLPQAPAALGSFSGTLLDEAGWSGRANAHPPLPVLVSHGRQDPILPFEGSTALAEMLERAGHRVTFLPFTGGHTIPRPALTTFAGMLRELVAMDPAGSGSLPFSPTDAKN